MGASQTVLPFKLAANDEPLTARSRLALVGEYLRAMGVCGLIDHQRPARVALRDTALRFMSYRWF